MPEFCNPFCVVKNDRLLRELDPDEEKFYLEGYKEVEEMIGKIKQ